MITDEDIAERVDRGIRLLEEKGYTKWHGVNTETLDMEMTRDCILGQLGGWFTMCKAVLGQTDYIHGFFEDMTGYSELIGEASRYGFALSAREFCESPPCITDAEWEYARKLYRRLTAEWVRRIEDRVERRSESRGI